MMEWKFENGIEVYEAGYNYDLHCFRVYDADRFLGVIYPDSIDEMKECINDLDAGVDPITDGWEDGCGNPCTMEGWGSNE